MRRKPAIRIIFAPLARRARKVGDETIHIYGEADKKNRTIWLDPRLSEVGKTLVHELLHIRHPSWSEEKVVAEEELRWNRMTWKQKANLYRMLGSAKLEGEDE